MEPAVGVGHRGDVQEEAPEVLLMVAVTVLQPPIRGVGEVAGGGVEVGNQQATSNGGVGVPSGTLDAKTASPDLLEERTDRPNLLGGSRGRLGVAGSQL